MENRECPVTEDVVRRLREEVKELESIISQIEHDSAPYVDDILRKVCKRAIRRMNKDFSGNFSLCDDLPSSFSFYDQLTFLRHTRDYDEIFFVPGMLQDYVEGALDDELDNLSEMEKLVLRHSNCNRDSFCFYDEDDIRYQLYCKFEEIMEEHSMCTKIQRFVEISGFF